MINARGWRQRRLTVASIVVALVMTLGTLLVGVPSAQAATNCGVANQNNLYWGWCDSDGWASVRLQIECEGWAGGWMDSGWSTNWHHVDSNGLSCWFGRYPLHTYLSHS